MLVSEISHRDFGKETDIFLLEYFYSCVGWLGRRAL